MTRGSYPNAVEYRFASSSGLQIRNNLSDAGIQARDGATATVSGNTTNAQLSWFVNAAAADLHLVSTAPVINQASVLADVPLDFDGQSRGSSPDVGADEFGGTTPGDTTPPVISSIAAGSITSSGATVTWTTNEASNTQVEYGLTTSYGSQTTLNTSMVTGHSAQLSGLTAGTLYHYRVKSRDAAGNLSVSADRTFTTAAAPDTTPPVISSIAAGSITSSGATITWTTNEASNTQVEYGLTTSYGSQSTLNTSLVTSHSAPISGLTAGTLYHYRVMSRDAAGNLSVSADRTFTTAAAPDTTPPVISSIAAGSITSSGATITWITNEASNTQVEYGLTTSYGSQTTLNTSLVTNHSAPLTGLTAGTLYHYRVMSRDAAGNLSVSADRTLTTTAITEDVYSYDNPRPLPPSNPSTTVNVSTISQLIAALNNLQSGQTVSLAAGTYDLSGIADALYVREGVSNWTIRGATGDRDDVVIRGGGMSGSVRFGVWVGNSPGGTIADLTIDSVREHGVMANYGAHDTLIHNLRIVDSGDQFIKSTSNGADGNDRGVVEYSVFEYRTTDNNSNTNGISIQAADRWIVRYNLFRNFLSPTGQGLAGPAVLAWDGSSNTTVEGNTFFNVARGVSLGLVDMAGGFDHQGGVIRNNFFYRSPSLPQAVDVPIMVADSPDTQILHNTILNGGSYPNAIEYRFPSASRLQIRNNLTDARIQARDGGRATVRGNTTSAQLSWFVNPAAGDLHLLSTAPVIDKRSNVLSGATLDVDGQLRDTDPDVGADEYVASASLAAATFTAALAVEPTNEELLTSSQDALGVDDETPATSEVSAASSLESAASTTDEMDQPTLIDLLTEEVFGNLLAPEGNDGAEDASLSTRLADAMDALWESFG
jgi:hypothetical protein